VLLSTKKKQSQLSSGMGKTDVFNRKAQRKIATPKTAGRIMKKSHTKQILDRISFFLILKIFRYLFD
jgi:hypothetical protein